MWFIKLTCNGTDYWAYTSPLGGGAFEMYVSDNALYAEAFGPCDVEPMRQMFSCIMPFSETTTVECRMCNELRKVVGL